MPPKKCLSSTFPVIASHVVTWCVDWQTGNPSVCQWSVKWDVYHTATFGMFMLVFAKCSKTAEKLDVSVWFSEPSVWLNWSLFFCCLVTKLCPTACDPMDCTLPGFSVHGDSLGKNTGVGCHFLLQGSSWPRDQTYISCVCCFADGFFTAETPGKPQVQVYRG